MHLDTIAERYEEDGFCYPIRVISEREAAVHLARVVEMEEAGEDRGRFLRSKAHLACRFIDELARTPAILDWVERILGPDILLWGSTCFVKAPRSPSYVSWHQDLNYWGLDRTDEVSAWIALSESNEANGCMRFVPGSHRRGPITHDDTFELDNMLTRGQELAVEVDDEEAVPVCLAPGEMSLHHGRMFHSSGPNTSNRWRAGLALRYITPSTRQDCRRSGLRATGAGGGPLRTLRCASAPARRPRSGRHAPIRFHGRGDAIHLLLECRLAFRAERGPGGRRRRRGAGAGCTARGRADRGDLSDAGTGDSGDWPPGARGAGG